MPRLELPEFPPNSLGLTRGTILRVIHPDAAAQLGLALGDRIPIGFDGTYVRSFGLTWSIEQLTEEIAVHFFWDIDGCLDLSDEKLSLAFARRVERLDP
jgi:hypothetical protein